MNIENLIHRRKAERDLSNSAIAGAMSTDLGERVSPESVGHYFTGNAGIPIDKLGAFLSGLGLKVVREEEVLVSSEKLSALLTLAKEALHVQGGDSRAVRR